MARRSGEDSGLTPGELVDEEAVALVGGDAPGAGVRLGDEALVLQRRHVVADGGRGDAEAVPLGERLGADGLLGADVVLDDGAQHFEPAFAEHRAHLQSCRRVPCGLPSRLALSIDGVPASPGPVYGRWGTARARAARH